MTRPGAPAVALGAGLAVVLLGLPVLVGIVVDRAAEDRMREFLRLADTVAGGRDVEVAAVNRLRNDAADALGDHDCSDRVLRLLRRHLPDDWSVQAVSPDGVRLTAPNGPVTLDCS